MHDLLLEVTTNCKYLLTPFVCVMHYIVSVKPIIKKNTRQAPAGKTKPFTFIQLYTLRIGICMLTSFFTRYPNFPLLFFDQWRPD